MLRLRTTFRPISAICPKIKFLSIQTQKNHARKFGEQQEIAVSLQYQKRNNETENNKVSPQKPYNLTILQSYIRYPKMEGNMFNNNIYYNIYYY
jgi:hypothetical protein